MTAFPRTLVVGLVSLLALVSTAPADAIRTGFSSNSIPANDDASFGPQGLGFDANFFGTTYSSAFVNINGNLTFGEGMLSHSHLDLAGTGKKIIAPFFADVDTTLGNLVTWGTGTVDGRNAFAITWPGVGFYPSRTDLLNHFQVVLIDRSDTGAGNFDIEFNYDQIQWETGGHSGGVDGLGGESARVGFADGSGSPGHSFELLGSGVDGALVDGGPQALVSNKLNNNVNGRYVFQSRGGEIDPDNGQGQEEPPPSETPEPASLVLAGLGLAFLAGNAYRGRRRFPLATPPVRSVQVD